jgi:mannose-P-dolichol utilization defect protein 1
VDDTLILYGFVAGFILNAVLAAQMMYYWNTPSSKTKGKRKVVGASAPVTSVKASSTRASTKGRAVTRRKA